MGHKYVGLDVHQSSTVAVVDDEQGKSVMESILATEAEAIRDFLKGLRGTIHVTFEEGTQAAWLYEIVKPVVAEVIVCNPRRNKLLAVGNKADRVDAQKLAELLRCGQLKPVYHGTPAVRLLKELVHSYDSLVSDTTRVMNRVKAIYRGRAIGCAGREHRVHPTAAESTAAGDARVVRRKRRLEVANSGDLQAGKDSTDVGKSHSCERATMKSPIPSA